MANYEKMISIAYGVCSRGALQKKGQPSQVWINQFVRISSAGAGGVDRGGLGDGDFSFACWRFNKAGCGRSPGSDDKLAGLGLDTGPRRLKTTHMQAKEKYEA
jgi:hypothetical protein